MSAAVKMNSYVFWVVTRRDVIWYQTTLRRVTTQKMEKFKFVCVILQAPEVKLNQGPFCKLKYKDVCDTNVFKEKNSSLLKRRSQESYIAFN